MDGEAVQPGATDPRLTVAGLPVSGYRWVVVAGLVASNWSISLPFISLGLLLPAIRNTFSLSDAQAGWLGSSLLIGNVIVAIPAAIFLSRMNGRRLAIAAIALGAGFTFLHGLAPAFAVLLLARVGFGLTFSIRNTARTLLVQLWYPLHEVPLANGIAIGFIGVAEFLALALTPSLLDATGSWRTTYFIFGSFALFILALWLVFGRDPKERTAPAFDVEERAPLRSVLRSRQLWLAGIGGFGAMAGWSSFATFWPTFMLDEHGLSLTKSGIVFGLNSAAAIPASLFLGYHASRIRHPEGVIIVSGLAMAAASAGMLLTTEFWALALLSSAVGLSWGFLPITYSIPFEIPGAGRREVAVGASFVTTLLFTGGIVGPVVVGFLSDATGSLFGALMVGALAPIVLALTGTVPGGLWKRDKPTSGVIEYRV